MQSTQSQGRQHVRQTRPLRHLQACSRLAVPTGYPISACAGSSSQPMHSASSARQIPGMRQNSTAGFRSIKLHRQL